MGSIRPDHPYVLRCIPDEIDAEWNYWAVGPYPLSSSREAWITDDESWATCYFTAEPSLYEKRARVYQLIDGVRYYLGSDSAGSDGRLYWRPDEGDFETWFHVARADAPGKGWATSEGFWHTFYVTVANKASSAGTSSRLNRAWHGGYLTWNVGMSQEILLQALSQAETPSDV